MSHTLLSVLFTGLIMSWPAMASEAEKVPASSDAQIVESYPILDEDFLTQNDWRKWEYRLWTRADINNDGKGEKIWVIADIKKDPNSSADNVKWLYNDNAPWAVVIETHEGQQTLVYLARSEFGRVEALVLDREEHTSVLIINRQTGSLSIYELKYQGPDQYLVFPVLKRDIQAVAQ